MNGPSGGGVGSGGRRRALAAGVLLLFVLATGWLVLRRLGDEESAAFPGHPAPGTTLWGAATGGNGDVVGRFEQPAGNALTLRRTFFTWAQRNGYLVESARDDIAHERVPWVSIKTPSWAAVAAGTYDREIDEFLRELDSLGGPVWLTVHHEPEGGGGVNAPDDPAGAAGHRAMNRRVRQRMQATGTQNIALALVLMEWTWDDRSGRNPDEWWEPGVYDIVGIDTYKDREATVIDAEWFEVRAWAAARGVDVAVGEWGMRGTDAAAGARVRELYDHARGSATDGLGARVVGLAAFDSELNTRQGPWVLTGEQYTSFLDIVRELD